jgi:hypothetical protein
MRSQSNTKISPIEPPPAPIAATEAPPASLPPTMDIPAPSKAHENTTAYLKKLLQRHTAKADFVQSYTTVKEQHFEEEIISGRYNIHKREWSAEEERLRASRSENRNTADVCIHSYRSCTPSGS